MAGGATEVLRNDAQSVFAAMELVDDTLQDQRRELDQQKKEKAKEEFRNYTDCKQLERVVKFYTEQHEKQTMDFVLKTEQKFASFDKFEMSLWDALLHLEELVDGSDPDTQESQMVHALQSGLAALKAYPGEEYDWFHVTVFIHDLGKILATKMGMPQWAVVGDTFPVGCKFSDKIILNESFRLNPDNEHKVYSTKLGIYAEGCGLDKVHMSWGHDEYLYRVLKANNCKLPEEGMYCIRFHSFYAWHRDNAYDHLCTHKDRKNLVWVKRFNQFDLYSKADDIPDLAEAQTYFKKKIEKYCPGKLKW